MAKQKTTVESISIGGWFQRTTLHLSEIYDFLKYAESPLKLEGNKLKKLQKNINPQNLTLHVGELDHITFNANNVDVVIYEDGLITLSIRAVEGGIADEIERLTSFYENTISPGFSYIFSLGAPVPKELASIKTIYPYFVVFNKGTKKEVNAVFDELQEIVHFEINKKDFDVLRGNKLYVINNKKADPNTVTTFIEEEIFTREFKGQMHRYLNLHRIIWEKIAEVKERGKIKGKDISPFKSKIEQYNKSINLIGARIAQMDSYIGTRGAIAHKHLAGTEFLDIIGYRYETLANTLQYVKHIWSMTENYIDSANALFGDLQAEATSKSIENLTIVTSMGVGAALLDLFNTSRPEFSGYGIIYVFILAAIGFSVSRIMQWWGLSKEYGIDNDELSIKD